MQEYRNIGHFVFPFGNDEEGDGIQKDNEGFLNFKILRPKKFFGTEKTLLSGKISRTELNSKIRSRKISATSADVRKVAPVQKIEVALQTTEQKISESKPPLD